MLLPVIICGGSGTRLWPVSRQLHPKPFMKLSDGESFIQKTLKRACLNGVSDVLTLTNRDLYFLTRDEYAEVEADINNHYVLEPCGRNTAPAVALAAKQAQQQFGDDCVMLVLPSDHLIEDANAFQLAVDNAVAAAHAGYLATFGIVPTRAETGFGYIQKSSDQVVDGVFQVVQFVEKPDLTTATDYVDSGKYLWNSGMFCFKAGLFLSELAAHAPALSEAVESAWQARSQQEPVELPEDLFAKCEDISIDYAVMEKSGKVAVVESKFDWSDIGSWEAYADTVEQDEQGNGVSGEVLLIDSEDNLVVAEERLVATVGVDGLAIIDTPDALLVMDKRKSQDVKKVVAELKKQGHESFQIHRTAHRPWGTYTVLEDAQGYKIKRIDVKPGASLSLQMHYHRSEHWIVVSGTAEVVNGEQTLLVRKNESTYIPAGHKHQLKNPGMLPLVLIEVQSGDYLEEDDIVRFSDQYGRT